MEQYDLKGCMFDVFSLPTSVNILSKFPKLAIFPEFVADVRLDKNKVIRYVIAVYDKRGLRIYEQSIPKRKLLAAELAGFERDKNGLFPESIKAIMEGKNKAVNRMVVRYCKLHKSPRYSALVGMEEMYYNLLDKMVDGAEMKSTDLASFRSLESEIEDRAIEFLNGDKTSDIIQSIHEDIELERLELRPEDIAKRLKDKKKIVDISPYEDYTFDQLRLIVTKEEEDVEGGH